MKVEKIINKIIERMSNQARSAAPYLWYTLFDNFEAAK